MAELQLYHLFAHGGFFSVRGISSRGNAVSIVPGNRPDKENPWRSSNSESLSFRVIIPTAPCTLPGTERQKRSSPRSLLLHGPLLQGRNWKCASPDLTHAYLRCTTLTNQNQLFFSFQQNLHLFHS